MIDPPLTPEEIASYERNPLTGPQDDRVLPLEKYGLNGELTPFFVHQARDRVNHVYIAGPMTGIEEYNFPAFHAAADELRGAGFTVHNPADHGLVPGAKREDYLRYDFRELLLCEYIYFLKGWETSDGAKEEHKLAQRFGLRMLFQPGAYVLLIDID